MVQIRKVIVTDSAERAALSVIRSLGQQGIEVLAADSTGFTAGALSKYCARSVLYPSPLRNKKRFVDSLLRLVKHEAFDLLVPVTDYAMLPILERRDEFDDYVTVAAPPYQAALNALDKARTMEIVQAHGIPCLMTRLVEDEDALRQVAREIHYPVVIKPRMKALWEKERALNPKVLSVTATNYARNPRDLKTKYAKIVARCNGFPVPRNFFLVQEYIKGNGYGVEVLMHDAQPKAVFTHRRLREYPICGGVSTLCMSVRGNRLRHYAVDLLRALDWRGVAMVEFKINEARGDVRLLEVNGRFWGSLSLAMEAGVDFPYLLYQCLVENGNVTVSEYTLGIKQRWLLPGDLLWFAASIYNGGKIATLLKQFVRSLRFADSVISLRDLAPTLGALRTALAELTNLR